jgi:hypothetical protein
MADDINKKLWGLADRTGGSEACWPFFGAKSRGGYGSIRLDGKHWVASRLAYAVSNGPIPTGAMIRHRCDNSSCVNPAHLEAGTHKDNMRDASERKRMASGERHYNSKLTEKKVKAMRAMFDTGASERAVAAAFGVRHFSARQIKLRATWAHV